jgi:hypothetical protein
LEKPVKQGIVVLAAAIAVLVLSACTAVKLTYNHADDIVKFMASDYFDLDERQQDMFRGRFSQLHQWHRANELPRYAEFLHTASGRVAKGLDKTDVDWATEALRGRYRQLAGRAAQEAAPILATLEPAQIGALEKKFAKNNRKHVSEWLPGDARKRERRFYERTVERFEEWTGTLAPQQRELIEQFVKAHPRIMEIRYAERQRWQREVVEILTRHRGSPDLGQRLARTFTDPESGRSAEYVRENRRYESDLRQLIVDIDRTLTGAQRELVTRRMERYADDFRALAGSPKVAVAQ